MIEFWQLMLIVLIIWLLYGITKPIVKPTVTDILFKKHVEDEIRILLKREKQNGLNQIFFPRYFQNPYQAIDNKLLK